MSELPIQVAAFYRFAPVADPAALAPALRAFGAGRGLVGSITLAREGVNGTVAGAPEAVRALLDRLREEPGLAGLAPRLHAAGRSPFARWKVKVKPEIVTMGIAGIDAARDTGSHVDPADWDALIADPGTILIDARNDYEVALGAFDGAIDPVTRSFGDFPAWFDAQAAQWRAVGPAPRIAMYCTGGIRCEKATAYARSRGFGEVYHLRGGILAYLARIDEARGRWRGECFLFDERVSLTHGERAGTAGLCPRCGQPVAPSAHRCVRCAGAGEAPEVGEGGALP